MGRTLALTTGYIRTRPSAVLAYYLHGLAPQADHPRAETYLHPHQPSNPDPDTGPAAADYVHATAAAVREQITQQRRER